MARLSNQPLRAGQRIAARVEYHGGHYHGWQAQPHLVVPTVQEALEEALQKIAGLPVRTVCAGRTDTGVHAFGQVVHFDDPVGRSPKAWVMGTNRHLPANIRVHWAVPVATEFHARFSATARRYRYIILNSDQRPALLDGLVAWERRKLDVAAMNEAAQCL
ncbi:MAG: tRNA pseudouridine synthase A, partial [Halieaceae bacterium]|nr:tRNA pseudouridine synthase A [Halieaceae bacterium]